MDNTIRHGDTVLVDRTAQVHRGDVIVEQQQARGPVEHIRRVIGLPGDHVACCDDHGRITVNGKPLDETYLYPADAPSLTRFNTTVPQRKLWLLGDHRSLALDSRIEGPLAVQVVGRVFLVIRSGHAAFLRTPHAFTAEGLAPASGQVAPALIGALVFALGVILLLALAIFGMVRYAMHKRGGSHSPEPHSVSV
jgi:signal peptidase I